MARSAPPDAFGRAAHEYELGRPDWPAEAVDRVVAELGLPSGVTVLDLAAGTGKLTRVLAERFERVLSVSSIASQPDEDRRALALQLRELIPDRPYRRFFTTDLYWTRRAA